MLTLIFIGRSGGAGPPAATFRRGSHTRHGSVAERNVVPARPDGQGAAPAHSPPNTLRALPRVGPEAD